MADITRNEQKNRYEASVDGQDAGLCQYQDDGKTVTFTHTVVEPAFEGQGVGSAMAKFALDDCRSQGKKVVPACAFIRSYIERHEAYQSLVSR